MKKQIPLFLVLLLMFTYAVAQIGIGTDQPRGALDINDKNTNTSPYGLVLPTNDPDNFVNPQTGDEITSGTIIYDNVKNCVKIYTGTTWSECIRGINEDEEWIHEHVVRWGYGNWTFGIGHSQSSQLLVDDLVDGSIFGHGGIYDKVPAIEMREITEQQLAKPEYIRYRFDVISVDGTALRNESIQMLVDFAAHGGSVIINLNHNVDANPNNPIFGELGFREINKIVGNTTGTNNFTVEWGAPLTTLFGNSTGSYGLNAGNFVDIPKNSLPVGSIIYAVTPSNNAAIWTCGPGNRILMIHNNSLYSTSLYANRNAILMKNLIADSIDRTLENRK